MSAPTVIEVFADVSCPFTHVGLRRLVERRAELGRSDVVLWVRAWPLEVVNGEPLDPAFIAEEVEVIREAVAPELFGGFRPDRFPATSLPALALAAAGYRIDRRRGEAVSLALRDLLFDDGADIADPDVLGEVAAANDLTVTEADHAAVAADHAEGVARGVVGSPHFFTGSADFFCPSLDVSRDAAGELQVAFDRDGFEQFMRSCF